MYRTLPSSCCSPVSPVPPAGRRARPPAFRPAGGFFRPLRLAIAARDRRPSRRAGLARRPLGRPGQDLHPRFRPGGRANGPWPSWPTTPRTSTSPSSATTGSRTRSRPPWPTATPSAPTTSICINLDTFNDRQSLYAFYVNPLGIQTDSRFASNAEDFSVDFVWSSAGRLDPDGYTVELAVPFKSIRYAGKERVEMSIFFERRIARRSRAQLLPGPRPGPGLLLPDPDDAARARGHPERTPCSRSCRPSPTGTGPSASKGSLVGGRGATTAT